MELYDVIRTTFAAREFVVVCAVMPRGKPVTQFTKLTRQPVSVFAYCEGWGGAPLSEESRA